MKLIISFVEIIRDIRDKKINIYAGHASLFLLLALIPFAMVIICVCQYLSPDIFDTLIEVVHKYMGDYASDAVDYIIKEIHVQSNTWMWVAVISAIWSSSAGTFSIERGLNIIYHNDPLHGYLIGRIISFFYTIFLVAMLMSFMVLVMFGKVLKRLIVHFVPSMNGFLTWILEVRILMVVPILLIFLMFLYTFYPGRKVRFLDQFWGALCSSLSLYVFTVAFEYYINRISNYSVLYGSMGAVMLFVLWMYFSVIVILYGAELNSYFKGTR